MSDDDDHLPTTRAELDDLPMWATIRLARGFEHLLGEVLAPLELTPIQFGALAQLSIEPFLTQSQLAHRILMRPQSANHLLDALIGRGLVERTGARGSGRPNPVRLTAAGRELLAVAWPRVVEANEPAALGLDADAAVQFGGVIGRLLERQSADGRAPRP